MMNGELPSLGDVNPKTTLKGVQLSQSYNPLTYNAHTSSHPSDGLWLFVTLPTKRAAYSCNPPRARPFPMKVRRGICWHIALSLRSSVTLGNNGPLQIQLIDGAFVLGSLADQRRRVWPEWQEKKRRQFEKCATGSECLRVSWAPPPTLSLVLLQFHIHINGVGGGVVEGINWWETTKEKGRSTQQFLFSYEELYFSKQIPFYNEDWDYLIVEMVLNDHPWK